MLHGYSDRFSVHETARTLPSDRSTGLHVRTLNPDHIVYLIMDVSEVLI